MALDQTPDEFPNDDVETEDDGDTPVTRSEFALLLKALSKQADSMGRIAEINEQSTIRQIPLTKVIIKTPWVPEGTLEANRPQLRRATYISGARCREILMSFKEIELANQLKAGQYHDGKWLVMERGQGDGSSVDILIPNKTLEQRIELKGSVRNFEDLLQQIIDEQHAREKKTA